ncbi:MAG: hypothetical protein OXH57_12380 [Ekhidna sp.]|nr:hypothetical protein [Ekhidna sp.]
MKELSSEKMEQIEGGRRLTTDCGLSIAGALIFGTGGIIAAAGGPVGIIAFAIASNYFAWGMAARACVS